MKGFNIKSIAGIGKMGLTAMNRNLPAVLSGCAIAGLIATVYMAVKAAPKVEEAVANAKDAKGEDDLNAWETFTATAPHAWKPAVCGVFTVGCIVGAHVLNVQRLTMLAGAYKLSESKLKEYEDKAKEIFGEEKAKDLHDAVVKEEAAKVSLDERFAIRTGKGKQLFLDRFSGRYFYSSKEAVLKAESDVNINVADGGAVTLNDLYNYLGLEEIPNGEGFGWGYNTRTTSLEFDIVIDERLVNEEKQVVYILDYEVGIDREYFR